MHTTRWLHLKVIEKKKPDLPTVKKYTYVKLSTEEKVSGGLEHRSEEDCGIFIKGQKETLG
jgi:hypothetical protein